MDKVSAAGPHGVQSSMVRGWPSLLLTMTIIGAAAFSFSPRPAPPFAPTQIYPDRLIINALARSGAKLTAVGEDGVILNADNPAGPWTQAKVEPTRGSVLTQVLVVDDHLALAVGHDAWILRSEDGGTSWKEVFFDKERSDPLIGVAGPYDGTIYAFGAFGRFMVSTDQGKTWLPQTHEAMGDHHLNAMTKIGDGSLMLVGERGLMVQSRDAGVTWTKLPEIYNGSYYGVLPLPSSPVPSSAQGVRTEGAILAFGMRGNAFVSADLGKTWSKSEIPDNKSLFGGTVTDKGQIILVGASNTVMVSDDAGAHFHRASEVDRWGLATVVPLPDGTALVGSDGGIHVHKLAATGAQK